MYLTFISIRAVLKLLFYSVGDIQLLNAVVDNVLPHYKRTFLGLVTLTLELDLDIFSHDLHAGIQACMSVRLARIVRRTDGHTHAHTNNAKTITPSNDAGCNDLGGVKRTPRNQGRPLHTGCV